MNKSSPSEIVFKNFKCGLISKCREQPKKSIATLSLKGGGKADISQESEYWPLLQLLSRSGIPVGIETAAQPESARLFETVHRIVEDFRQTKIGIVGEFSGSGANRFHVAANNPSIGAIAKKLAKSRKRRVAYWFVLGDSNRSTTDQEVIAALMRKKEIVPSSKALSFKFSECSQQPISIARARRLFRFFLSQSTPPQVGELEGLPFLYASGGCEDRCHVMCKCLLEDEKIAPLKVWAFCGEKALSIRARNHPACGIPWAWHTAPVVRTDDGLRVIDPSVSNDIEPINQWYERFSAEGSVLHCTSHHVYMMLHGLLGFESDPTFERALENVMIHRINLRIQTLRRAKPSYSVDTEQQVAAHTNGIPAHSQ